jgi:hypothetical protein
MRAATLTVVLLAATTSCGGGGSGPWRSYSSPGSFGLNAVWAFAPDDVWAGGELMLHFDGAAFTQVATPPAAG